MSRTLAKPRLLFRWRLDEYPTALVWRGGHLAAADAGGELWIGDLTGRIRRRLTAHPGGVLALAWQPGSECLVSSGQDGQVLLWRLDGGITPLVLPETGAWVESVAWSPNGRWLALGCGRVAALYDADGRLLGTTAPHPATLSGIAWSPDSRHVATGGYRGAKVWTVPERQLTQDLSWQGALLNLVWSPDGRILAGGCQDCTVHFWRLADGRDAMMAGYPLKPADLCWSPDNVYLATTGSSDVTLWPFDPPGPEGRRPLLLELHEAPLSVLAFAPRSPWLASACRDGLLAIWRVGEGEEPVQGVRMRERICALAWSEAEDHLLLAAASIDGEVGVWYVD